FRIGAMHVVRKRDVDGVNLAAFQALVELFVGICGSDAILARQLFQLLWIARNKRRQLRVFLRVRKGGQNGNLRNVAKSYDGVSDFRLLARAIARDLYFV